MRVVDLGDDPLVGVLVLLGLCELHVVGEWHLGALLVEGVVGLHDLDLDAHDALLEEDVPNGHVQVVELGLARGDHVADLELHGLGSLLLELAGDDDLAALGAVGDGALEHGVGGQPQRDLRDELELHGLGEGRGAQALLVDLLHGDGDAVPAVAEPLLDHRLQLPDLPALLADDGRGLRGSDPDLGLGQRGGELEASVTGVDQGSGEEGVHLGVEDTVGHELSLLVDLTDCGHCGEKYYNIWIN